MWEGKCEASPTVPYLLTTLRKTGASHFKPHSQCVGTYYKQKDRSFNQHKAETPLFSTKYLFPKQKLENKSVCGMGEKWEWFYDIANV